MASANSSTVVVYGAIGANLAIAISKFVAAFFTGRAAMMSEGIRSLVDSGNDLLILFGMNRATWPADAKRPFGYSKGMYLGPTDAILALDVSFTDPLTAAK